MTIEEQIQTDLDNGKYGMICSNEDTFKKYVFPLIEKAKQEERVRIKNIIKNYKTKYGQWVIDDLINLI